MSNPVDIIAKLQHFHQGRQDPFLNVASFTLKLLSLTRRSMTNSKDNISTSLSNIAEHINSSRFALRFLSGVSATHQIINSPCPFAKMNFSSDNMVPTIRYLQQILQIAYNLFELPAYIHTVAPTIAPYNGPFFGAMSCQVWFLTTLLELIAQTKLRTDKVVSGREYKTAFIVCVCDMLLSCNWSLPPSKQFLSEWSLTVIGCISAWVAFCAEWKRVGAELKQQKKALGTTDCSTC